MPGRSRLETQEGLIEQIAEGLHAGQTREEIAAAVGASKDSISNWSKDRRVQQRLSALREERINAITSKIDSRLMSIINTPDALKKLSPKDLIEIRRELLPPKAQQLQISKGDEAAALAELYQKLAENPEAAAALGFASFEEADEPIEALPAPSDDEPYDV